MRLPRRSPGLIQNMPGSSRPASLKILRGRIWGSWLIFIGAFLTMHALLAWAGQPGWEALNEWTARLTAVSLNLLGAEAHAEGKIVRSSLVTIEIIRGCTGIHQIMMYVSAVIAYPCRWRPKFIGIGLGIVALLLVTQVRVVSLCYVGSFFPAHFEFAHMVLWQSLAVIITVFLWILWAITMTRDHETRSS